MADILEEVQALRSKVADLAKRRARREADLDLLKSKLKEDLAALKKEFGVSTVEEAKNLLASLEQELREDVDRLRAALEEA